MRTKNITGNRDKRRLTQQVTCFGNAARGFQRSALGRIRDACAELTAIAECVLDHLTEMRVIDDDLCNAGAYKIVDVPNNQWSAPHLQQRLGTGIGQRAHALSATSSENHGFHIKR